MKHKASGISFMALGAAFAALGVTGQKTYLGLGVVFLVLGIVQLRRANNP